MPKTNIPPLTKQWLEARNACSAGRWRFAKAAPSGSLTMDKTGAALLAKYCLGSDLRWLLHHIISNEQMREVRTIAWRLAPGDDWSGEKDQDFKRRLAAACVAAWREYHR